MRWSVHTALCGHRGARTIRGSPATDSFMNAEREYTLPIGQLPLLPWGILYNYVNDELARIKRPGAWLSHQDISESKRIAHFEDWCRARLAEINEHLWPRYDPDSGAWIGESAKWMRNLTEADLNLMIEIQQSGEIQKYPRLTGQPSDPKTHVKLFGQEDANNAENIWNGFGSYCQADEKLVAQINEVCEIADGSKELPINYWFKSKLQRPRPWQTALWIQRRPFVYFEATSSMTPSMCSGHCFQSLVSVGAAIERMLDDNPSDPMYPIPQLSEKLSALAQWAVDIGDRRVMAGVHYPSDNICSWFLFLTVAEFIFHRPEVKGYMARAISNGFVFQEIQRSLGNGGDCYRRPLSLIFSHSPVPGEGSPEHIAKFQNDNRLPR